MSTALINTTVLTPKKLLEDSAVVISDEGKIIYVGPMEDAPHVDGRQLDLNGYIVAPGFIDVHVHGGRGIVFGLPDGLEDSLHKYSEWVAQTGVTGFLLSIAAPDAELLAAIIEVYAEIFEKEMPGAEPLGLHLEGPFLNREKKGAFNPAWLREPNLDETEAFIKAGRGWIRQVTLAPELPGAEEVASKFREAGVVVAMGHTNTDFETASAALRGNWNHVTHTFNAQRGFGHRSPGVFGAILASDDVTTELIADLIHVHPGAMKILVRSVGVDRVVLITDAMPGAGLDDGVYDLVGHEVTVKGGIATLEDGTLAGSTAQLNQCVGNTMREVGVTLNHAVQMATLNPARAMGLEDRLGMVAEGKDASLIVIDEDVNVFLTMVKGEIVYQNL
ncbi:MAG: N-acetylglucosamine-6-phosphate deacetylase [Anaerolineaceae bacterium]|nr:MAG: N-acetylglucosamine-6-phosphate deacetylase [Anaerolineaceae bacterium]